VRNRHFSLAALLILATALGACSGTSTSTAPSTNDAAPHHTFVIVHGAWGGGWAFREVDRLMAADGNKIYRPTLTGQGERSHLASPHIGLETHIMDIVNVIRFEDLRDVVLVGHSYGGMVVTGVADRLPDRIAKLVYVDAVLPEDGESLDTAFGNASGKSGLPMKGRVEKDGFLIPNWVKPDAPYPHDVPHSVKTFHDPIHLAHAEALRTIPTVYILTVDKGQPPEKDTFYPFYQRAIKRGIPAWIMEGDHNVQWSHPKELAKLLEKAAG
jgi:pimeloyl-ACP methyl ester carboxylesterase